MHFFQESGEINLNPNNLIAEGMHAYFISDYQGLLVVFRGLLGVRFDVGEPKSSLELSGDRFRVCLESFDGDVIDVVCIKEEAGARKEARMTLVKTLCDELGTDRKEAKETWKGCSLKRSIAFPRKESVDIGR